MTNDFSIHPYIIDDRYEAFADAEQPFRIENPNPPIMIHSSKLMTELFFSERDCST